jgi:UDP-N-acetylglucosamine:LPS N-acetylglucosamine transferase
MLLNFDASASLRDLYFPFVGMENHVVGRKCRLGIWVEGCFRWLDDDQWIKSISYRPGTLVSDFHGLHPDLPVEVLHQSGEALLDEARAAYASAGVAARVEPFIADMAQAYAWADLVVCRAGALTLAELCAVGVGSVLVPFPLAVDDHQTRNAEYLVERGAALLLPQADDLAPRLRDALRALSADPARRLAMAEAARALAMPDAAGHVAEAVLAALPNQPRNAA